MSFLQRTKEYAARYQTGIHIHLVESFYQKEFGIRTWSKTPVAHLDELGFLGPEVSCAHSVWLTDADIELLARTNTTVCHNASSNLRLKNGVAPVNAMVSGGVNVAIGTDSTSINDDDDMLQEMRLVSKLHREPSIAAPAINSHQVLKMATLNAAQPTFSTRASGAGKGAAGRHGVTGPYFHRRTLSRPGIHVVDALLYRGKAAKWTRSS